MKTVRQTIKMLIVVAAFVVPTLWSAQAFAGAVALTLVRTVSLVNVPDGAGLWQHEAGTIQKGLATVGQYALHRRVTNGGASGGTTTQNTAMVTVTLFFSNTGVPPQNVTLEGAHAFSSGRFAGSVSAASNRYSWVHDGDATIIPTATIGTSTLTISWTGANQLTLP